MSSKKVGYDPQQVTELAAAVVAVQAAIEDTENTIKPILATLKGEDVFGQSAQKEKVLDAVRELEASLIKEKETLEVINKMIGKVNEAALTSAKANIRSVEEASTALAAAKNKIEKK